MGEKWYTKHIPENTPLVRMPTNILFIDLMPEPNSSQQGCLQPYTAFLLFCVFLVIKLEYLKEPKS